MIRWPDQLVDLLVPIEDVRQHPDNPNNGDAELIAEMIEVHGFYAPVAVQRSTGYILAGNHRYEALLSLDATSIPVVYLDVDDEGATRILLGDNKSSRVARLDPAAEYRLLLALAETDLGLLATGSHPGDLTRLARFTGDLPPDLPGEGAGPSGSPGHGMAHKCPHCGGYFG